MLLTVLLGFFANSNAPNYRLVLSYHERRSNNVIKSTSFSEDDVLFAVRAMKPIMTAGSDYISAFLVSDCGYIFAIP